MAYKRAFLALTIGCVLTITSTVASAIGLVTPQADNQDSSYLGVKWKLGQLSSPELSLGFRHAQVDADGDVEGNDFSMTFDIFDGFAPGEIRAKYLNGEQDLQGELSLGYDFSSGYFAGVSGQGSLVNLGVDYLYKADSPFVPYFQLNTVQEYDDAACPQNWVYNSGLCSPNDPD